MSSMSRWSMEMLRASAMRTMASREGVIFPVS
jgi:hypothetical protein